MFGIIYSTNTGRIRWHTGQGHSSEELDRIIQLTPGIALEKFDDSEYGDLFTIQAKLSAKTNLTPINDRFAIVDKLGNVTGAIIADPLIDSIPNMTLIAHPTASEGWTVNLQIQVFTAPISVTPNLT